MIDEDISESISKEIQDTIVLLDNRISEPMTWNWLKKNFMNSDKVHPLKHKEVADILNYLNTLQNKPSARVILFGSSITDRCTAYSDIDVCIDANKESDFFTVAQIVSNVTKGNCDILNYSNVSGRVKGDIDNGVCIYEA